MTMTAQRRGGHDHETDVRPSPEAQAALEQARRAKRTTEAIGPLADQVAAQVRRVIAENHFAELVELALEDAARGR